MENKSELLQSLGFGCKASSEVFSPPLRPSTGHLDSGLHLTPRSLHVDVDSLLSRETNHPSTLSCKSHSRLGHTGALNPSKDLDLGRVLVVDGICS